MHILLLHQSLRIQANADERDVLDQADAVAAALGAAGHQVVRQTCDLNLAALDAALRAPRPDLVFNLVESLGDSDRLLPCVPALLDARAVPYTGSRADTLFATTQKVLAKHRLHACGLPTPAWVEIGAAAGAFQPGAAAPATWLIKSVWEHASAGVHAANLLPALMPGAACAQLAAFAAVNPGDWYAEAYVHGREFNVSLLEGPAGVEVLPPAEIQFVDFPEGKPHILDYAAKWDAASFAYTHTPRRFDLPAEDAPLLETLRRLAQRCWERFSLRGYARIDFRVDAAGRPWILEINANPCLAPDAGFASALAQAAIPYPAAIARIVAASLPAATQPVVSGQAAGPACPPPPAAAAPAACGHDAQPVFRQALEPGDVARIRALVRATGFFHEPEVAIAVELVEERLQKGASSGYEFLLAEERDGSLAGYACFGLTPCTLSSFDLYWIAVHPRRQGQGFGRALMAEAERCIRALGGTRVYAETSSRPQYESTRRFYTRCGYEQAGLLESFYGPADGKATFLKVLP